MIEKYNKYKEEVKALYAFITTGEYVTVKKVMAITTITVAVSIIGLILKLIF